MNYSIVEDECDLHIRANITTADELRALIAALEERLTKPPYATKEKTND